MKKLIATAMTGALMVLSCTAPAHAQGAGAAPDMYNVREVILSNVHFPDAKASDSCSLTRDEVNAAILKAVQGTGVPVVPLSDARPPVLGIARISLIPEISTYMDENFDCISWVGLSAESRVNAVIPPVPTLRSVTVVYWRQRAPVVSSQSTHTMMVDALLEKMTTQFTQQYRLDQTQDMPK